MIACLDEPPTELPVGAAADGRLLLLLRNDAGSTIALSVDGGVGIDGVTSRVVVPCSYGVGMIVDTPGEGGPCQGAMHMDQLNS